MKNKFLLVLVAVMVMGLLSGCKGTSELKDQAIVTKQQEIYRNTQPIPVFEFSIPRDVYIQIYEIVTTKAFATYAVIETITGQLKMYGPSIGYPIPVDTSLTNPLQAVSTASVDATLEQAEPNGLFASKNTDGTWVLFVEDDGSVSPIYTEHKVSMLPYPITVLDTGRWKRIGNDPVDFRIDIKDSKDGKAMQFEVVVKTIDGEEVRTVIVADNE